MSKDDLDDFVIFSTPEPSISWTPEDFNFVMPEHMANDVWYFRNYELRSMKGERWLMRRKIKNKNNNSEMVVKWGLIKIPYDDVEFATTMFTRGLE